MREIKPENVEQLIRDGKLRFGMEIEFQDDPNCNWTRERFGGVSLYWGKLMDSDGDMWNRARFPRPDLRDGDPVVVRVSGFWCHRHFFGYCGEKINYYDGGKTRWSSFGDVNQITSAIKWRLPTRQELESAGFTESQIADLEKRRCVG